MARKRNRSRGSEGTISRRTLLLLLGGGAVGATGYYSSGAFGSVVGDRPFNIGTAGDDTALLGIDSPDSEERTVFSGGEVTFFEVTNRFETAFDDIWVDLHSPSNPPTNSGFETPRRLEPGESGDITATLGCSTNRTDEFELTINASNDQESVSATRSVEVTCLPVPNFELLEGPVTPAGEDIIEFSVVTDTTVPIGGFNLEIFSQGANEPDSFGEFEILRDSMTLIGDENGGNVGEDFVFEDEGISFGDENESTFEFEDTHDLELEFGDLDQNPTGNWTVRFTLLTGDGSELGSVEGELEQETPGGGGGGPGGGGGGPGGGD